MFIFNQPLPKKVVKLHILEENYSYTINEKLVGSLERKIRGREKRKGLHFL